MGLLPAALLAELQKPTPQVSMWLDIGPWPDGTTWRLSTHAEGTGAPGPGDPVVLKWGSLRKAVNVYTADLIPQELNPEITDEGDPYGEGRRRFTRMVAKWGMKRLRRTPVVLTWAGGGTTYTRFSGLLANAVQTGTMRWQLFCRTDDAALNDEAGASVPKAPQASYFTSTPDEERGQYIAIVMGSHDSNGMGGKGLIPLVQLDATRTRYGAIVGTVTVPAVYADEEIANVADYTVSTSTYNGLLATIVTFDTALAEGTVITADVDGLTDTVGGGGTLLKNGSQLLKWLVWFAFGDFRGGAYPLDATAPVHAAAFTALDTFLARNDHESSIFQGGTTQGKAAELHRRWHESHETRPYWRHDGKLAAGVLDPIPPSDIYAIPYHYEAAVDALSDMETPHEDADMAREVVVEYAPNASTGELTQKLRLMDVAVVEKVVVPLQLWNSGARVV